MQQFDLQVCLISDEAAPNFIPVCDKRMQTPKAIFLVSEKMQGKAESLKQAFMQKGIKDIEFFNFQNPYDIEEIIAVSLKIAEKYEDKKIAVNLTGGSKVMTIAVQMVFQDLAKFFYFQNNQIFWLEKENFIPQELDVELNIKDYLLAYSKQMLAKKNFLKKQEFLDVSKQFIKKFNQFEGQISVINALAAKAKKDNENGVIIDGNILKNKNFVNFLEKLKAEEMIEFYGNKVEFKSDEIREFFNGIWLEDYCFTLLKELKENGENIQDMALSIEIGNEDYNADRPDIAKTNLGKFDELDIAFLANNKLHLIECKTCKMNDAGQANAYLDKLLKHQRIGGRETKLCFVSYQKLPEASLNRAKENRIKVFYGASLDGLKNKLKEWINE